MAYGRVNVAIGSGGFESLKTIDSGKKEKHALIDYTRKRKIYSEYLDGWKTFILDFDDNIVATINGGSGLKPHVGFIDVNGSLYSIKTGEETDFPKGFSDTYFILNEEKDYLTSRYGIKNKNNNILHSFPSRFTSYSILCIQKDIVYFQLINSDERTIYKFEDRDLEKLITIHVRGESSRDLRGANLL